MINDKIKDLISENSVIKSRAIAKSILGLVSFIFSSDNFEASYDEKNKFIKLKYKSYKNKKKYKVEIIDYYLF